MKKTTEKSNRTITIIFIVVVLISIIIGFFVGGIAMRLFSSQSITDRFDTLCDAAIRVMPYAALLLNCIFCIIGFCLYAGCKKTSDTWDGEDEEVIERLEEKLSAPLIIPSVMMILNYLFFGVAFAIDTKFTKGPTMENIGIGIAFLTFILSFVWEMLLQGKVIALEKKLNPEKKGNILDLRFQKEWIESCDEAERMTIYRSAYDVYKLMSTVFCFAWLLAFVVSSATGTGLFAMILVTVLWLIQTVAYFAAAAKYQ